ncbi:MAG: hypothetical protein ACRDPP_09715 [Gaiellaceae bacterium]
MRALAAVVALLALAACGDEDPSRFAVAGCPVDEPALCERAAPAANALEEGDVAHLVELSHLDSFACDDLPAELFPDCSPGETLEGHAFTGADGTIAVLSPEEYEARLAELAGFDEVTVTGVGTCGPDDPARRSYHLGYLAERRGERWGGSLEFVLRDGEWSIGLVFADSIDRWKTQYSEPESQLACGNVQAWSRN